MSPAKIVVDTDILAGHLLSPEGGASVLRCAMRKFFCYTTVFNAIELFAITRSGIERKAVEDVMIAMKILGLNARSAKKYAGWFPDGKRGSRLSWLIAGICRESKLPLLTARSDNYRGVPGIRLMSPSALDR